MIIASLRSSNISDWTSCQSITKNLFETYNQINEKHSVNHYEYSLDGHFFELAELVKKLYEDKTEVLSFIDHDLTPLKILKVVSELYKDWRPKIIFHIFGDFTLYSPAWSENNELLKEFPVTFVSSSSKQALLLSSFLNEDNKTSSQKLSFPVETNKFKFDPSIRKETRTKLEIKEDETIYLYTGRLSLQKNIVEMVNLFAKSIQLGKDNCRLLIAGDFDDLGLPYTGQRIAQSGYMMAVMKAVLSLPSNIQTKISFLGNLNVNDLIKYYNCSDYYISLSTHNDEDYGMSPAEAMACGLPLILTNWGGFSSFCHEKYNETLFVEVKDNEDRIIPHSVSVLKSLLKSQAKNLDNKERENNINIAREVLSIDSNKVVLNNIIETTNKELFKGFNNKFKKMSNLFKSNPHAPFRGPGKNLTSFYYDIYECYIN